MESKNPGAAPAPKPTAAVKPAAKPKKEEKISNVKGIGAAFLVILCCAVVACLIFFFIMGAEANFEGNDPANGHPLNYWGTIYKGGIIVPILLTCLFTVIVLSVERWIAISSARGKGSVAKFVTQVKKELAAGKIDNAMNLCKKQRGSVAAVVHAVLVKYKEMDANTVLTKEQKISILRNEVEEATALEMPSLQQNLPIVATLTTLGTLIGLLGTVLGMIKSFQALAQSGAPDATQLSTGISEALINTATGIATGALAVISYNFYTNKIDNLTYAIDEVGFSIVATFSATH